MTALGEGKRSAAYMIAVMAGISAIGPFSVDAYLPALPAMADSLDAPASLLQMTLSVYLLGIAIFPLVLTPISDAIGRKPVLAAALICYATLSAACALALNAEMLVLFRLFQAAAGGVVMTVARAVVADQYSGDALSRAMSHVMLIFTIAPVIAPLCGSLLLELAGWRAIFWALMVYGLIGVVAAWSLNETLPAERRRSYNLASLRDGYVEIARSRETRRYLYLTFWSATFFFAMLTSAPFIFIEEHGFTALQFGYVFATISASAFLANILNARLVMRVGYAAMLRGVILLLTALATAVVVIAFTKAGGPWGILAGMIGLMGVFHILFANTTAGIMQQVPHRAGAISAVMALFRFVGGALGSAALGLFSSDQAIGLAVVLAVSALVMLNISRGLSQSSQPMPSP